MSAETMTAEQRLEVRRSLLQSVAEMGRGLKIISGFLKMGKFGMARDQIAAVDAMLQLHEMLAQELLKENRHLRRALDKAEALILDADSMLQETSVTLDGTAGRMHDQAMLPKSQRDPDFDHDDLIRYSHYASQAHSILARFRNIIAGQA